MNINKLQWINCCSFFHLFALCNTRAFYEKKKTHRKEKRDAWSQVTGEWGHLTEFWCCWLPCWQVWQNSTKKIGQQENQRWKKSKIEPSQFPHCSGWKGYANRISVEFLPWWNTLECDLSQCWQRERCPITNLHVDILCMECLKKSQTVTLPALLAQSLKGSF